jgi:hypothetical protein
MFKYIFPTITHSQAFQQHERNPKLKQNRRTCSLSANSTLKKFPKFFNLNLIKVFIRIRPLLIASKEIGLEVNAEKTKYMVMSRDQNARQNGYVQTGNE